jgi:hypothetical protein
VETRKGAIKRRRGNIKINKKKKKKREKDRG